MTSNDQLESLNELYQIIEQWRIKHNVTSHELAIHLLNVLHHIVRQNIKYAIAVPKYSFEAIHVNKQIKQAANDIIYLINQKSNVLKSLSKDYQRKTHGK